MLNFHQFVENTPRNWEMLKRVLFDFEDETKALFNGLKRDTGYDYDEVWAMHTEVGQMMEAMNLLENKEDKEPKNKERVDENIKQTFRTCQKLVDSIDVITKYLGLCGQRTYIRDFEKWQVELAEIEQGLAMDYGL